MSLSTLQQDSAEDVRTTTPSLSFFKCICASSLVVSLPVFAIFGLNMYLLKDGHDALWTLYPESVEN